MYRLVAISIFILVAWLLPKEAQAQVTYDGCYVGAGVPVPSAPSYAINDIAVATIDPMYGPVIYYNPSYLGLYTSQMQRFVYYHECAHHVRGHTLGSTHPLYVEQDADCWAIRSLVSSGQFSISDVRAVQAQLSTFGFDWTHLPGPQRAINLLACLA